MVFIKYSIILLLLFSTSTVNANGEKLEQIKNGNMAELGQFPYMVSIQLRYRSVHFCGGTLITNQHVLTAAHCFFASQQLRRLVPVSELQVRGGVVDLKKPDTFRDKRYVRQLFIHGEFTNSSVDNDIAILVLFSPRFQLTAYLQTAVLSREYIDEETVSDPYCYVVGWGRQCGISIKNALVANFPDSAILENKNMNTSALMAILNTITGDTAECAYDKYNYLQYGKVQLQDINECQIDYLLDYHENVLCAGTRGSNIDACKGDSGGPLICDDVLEGIISFGDGCNNPNHLGGYTRVYSHLKWIDDIISEASIKISKLSSIFYILSIVILLKIN